MSDAHVPAGAEHQIIPAMPREPDPRYAPAGFLWVCFACGKTAHDQYGDRGTSWDESCLLNSNLVDIRRLRWHENRVVEITDAI